MGDGPGSVGPGAGPAPPGAIHWDTRGRVSLRKLLLLLALLLVFDVVLFFVGPGGDPVPPGDRVFRVGLVFDVGGRGDKSFNDSAWNGLHRAQQELPVHGEYIEPGEGADRESALRMLAARGFDLVVGVGFIFTDDVTLVAREYPERSFACVDYAVSTDAEGRPIPPPPNVAALKFREEEGSFLVGAIAGLTSRSRAVGFIGGMDIPLIRKFEAGYRAGVRAVCPDCRLVSNYAGVTGAAFKDPGKGKELASTQYQGGVDVIFHASGSTGLGVFEAARLHDGLAIGVDADQQGEAPGHVLTSMVKRVDNAVYRVIKDVVEGKFRGGIASFGLTEDGVGFVADEDNARWLTPEVTARVEALRGDILAGRLRVPTRIEEATP